MVNKVQLKNYDRQNIFPFTKEDAVFDNEGISVSSKISSKQDKMQYRVLPEASEGYLGKVVQYIGEDSGSIKHNFFYECVSSGGSVPSYSWVAKNVQEASGATMVEITYSDLVVLRDGGLLNPGGGYRITDYQCTTKLYNTMAFKNVFDIIVTAIDESHLSEEAKAAHHEGDTYFEDSNLNAWKIWYSLDNDLERFDWADEDNGKGVIYRMVDEYNNDCPYDFKNIQFKANNPYESYVWQKTFGNSKYFYYGYGYDLDETCRNNTIKPKFNNYGAQTLNRITLGEYCENNSFGNDCENICLSTYCSYNVFCDGCTNSIVQTDSNYNTFGSKCTGITLHEHVSHISFGDGYGYSTIGSYSEHIKLFGINGSVVDGDYYTHARNAFITTNVYVTIPASSLSSEDYKLVVNHSSDPNYRVINLKDIQTI